MGRQRRADREWGWDISSLSTLKRARYGLAEKISGPVTHLWPRPGKRIHSGFLIAAIHSLSSFAAVRAVSATPNLPARCLCTPLLERRSTPPGARCARERGELHTFQTAIRSEELLGVAGSPPEETFRGGLGVWGPPAESAQ